MDVTQLSFKTFDAHNINDATNYLASHIPYGSPILASGKEVYSERVDQFPTDDGVRLVGRHLALKIVIKSGTLAQLLQWFDTSPKFETSTYAQPKILVATDGAAVDWYIYARPIDFNIQGATPNYACTITFFVADPIWRKVTATTDSWNITATGQMHNISVLGNKYARPKFVITPTNARTGGFAFKRYIPIVNRVGRIYRDAISITDAAWNTAALVNDTTVSNQINAGGGVTSAAGQTCPVDTAVGGGLPASGIGYCGTEQFSFTIAAGTMTWVTRGLNGTTAASHADNAVIAISRMAADGRDVRVINDRSGQEEYRWFGGGGINSTTTLVWVNSVLYPEPTLQQSGTVSGAISNVGAVATITLKTTTANKSFLQSLNADEYKFVIIDMGGGTVETFKFTAVNVAAYQITGVTRAQKNTTNQSHADGATIQHPWIGYNLMYGNSTLGTPTTDDTFKPMIDLANSTNTSHVYTDYGEYRNPNRLCQWVPQILVNSGRLSELYSANHYTFATLVYSEMGMAGNVYLVGTTPRSPTFSLAWSIFHPAGITTVTLSGEKYRFSTTWPAKASLQRSNDGVSWVTAFNEATPVVVQTWEALTTLNGAKALGATYLNVRILLDGTINALASNYAAMEVDAVTLTLDSANTPLILFSAVETANHDDFVLTNTTTGHTITVSQQIPVNTSVTIDTDNLEAYTAEGVPVKIALDDESRAEWMPFSPGVTNTLQYDETGANAVTVATTWADRNL